MSQQFNEEFVMNTIREILSEETRKVRREDYNKIQYKLDELENQLLETIKEFRKVEDGVPEGLKVLSNGRVKTISQCLIGAQKNLKQLKDKIREHKKIRYQSTQAEEKKIK